MASNDIPTRVSKPQRIIETIRISVICLGVLFVLNNDVGREHAADERVVQAAVHVYQTELVIVLVQGVAAVEGGGDVVVGQRLRVAPTAPGVEAVMRHGAACYDGIQAALVVFYDIAHSSAVV